MREELEWIISDLRHDNDVRVVVLTGEGKSFCAGGDIKTMGGRESIIGGLEREIKIMRIFRNLAYLEKPVIAGVDGAATGAGLSLGTCLRYRDCIRKGNIWCTFYSRWACS